MEAILSGHGLQVSNHHIDVQKKFLGKDYWTTFFIRRADHEYSGRAAGFDPAAAEGS